MLAEDAIKSAIKNYYTKHPDSQATDLSSTTASVLPEADVSLPAETSHVPQATAA